MKQQQLKVSTAIVGASTLEAIEKQAATHIKALSSISITTTEQFEKVAANVAKLKEYKREAEAQQAGIIDPLNLSMKNTRALFKPFFANVDNLEREAKLAMLTWVNARELAAKKVEQDFEDGKIKRISTVTAKTSELRNTTSENSSLRKVYKLTIVDAKKVPREYLEPNEAAIKEAFKRGEKVIGCKWEQENSIAI